MNIHSVHPRYRAGFTLLEAIITTSIICIVLAIGIPSFKAITQNNRMAAARNSITTHLNLARSEAVKRSIGVVLCPSDNGQTCADSTIWNRGFILYADNNGSKELELGEQILRYMNTTQDLIRIRTTSGRRKVAYNPFGYASGYNLTFTFCDSNSQVDPKAVIVSNSGRVRLSSTKPDGSQLDCS